MIFKKDLGLLVLILIVGTVVAIINPRFLLAANISNTANQIGLFGIIAIAQAFVIVIGGIELSVGAIVALLGVLFIDLIVNAEVHWVLATLIVIGAGMLMGLVHGTLVEWRVRPGDTVHRGDVVAEVTTDKGDIEVEIFESGVIEVLLVEPGTKVPVGTPLARIRSEGGAPVEPSPERRQRVSPLARKRAEALGVDLASIGGTGTGAVVTVADVEAAAAKTPRSAN